MNKTPVKIASVIFLVIGLLHLSRLLFHFTVVIGGWDVPLWINGAGAAVALSLSLWLFKNH